MIVQAVQLGHALPVPSTAAEDLVKLRDLCRCLVPVPQSFGSLSPGVDAVHETQYRAIFSLIRLDRKTIKEGTLHLSAVRRTTTVFARAGGGPSQPVVVVLLSDILLILSQCSFGMRVHEKCELRATSLESSAAEKSCELILWCSGVRHILLAASVHERRAWAEWLDITISSACERAARTPLQAAPVPSKHAPLLKFAGPTPIRNRNSYGGDAACGSDGEFEWEIDDEECHVGHGREAGRVHPRCDACETSRASPAGPANAELVSTSSLIHDLTTPSEFTAEWYPGAGRLHLSRLRPVGGWARKEIHDLSLSCSRGPTGQDCDAPMRIMSRSGKVGFSSCAGLSLAFCVLTGADGLSGARPRCKV